MKYIYKKDLINNYKRIFLKQMAMHPITHSIPEQAITYHILHINKNEINDIISTEHRIIIHTDKIPDKEIREYISIRDNFKHSGTVLCVESPEVYVKWFKYVMELETDVVIRRGYE